MFKFFFISLVLVEGIVSAQPVEPITLACRGKYSSSEAKQFDIPISTGVIKINNASILISGIPIFSSNALYEIVKTNDTDIFFQNLANKIVGSINRYTGFVNVINFSASGDKWLHSYEGNCLYSNRIF